MSRTKLEQCADQYIEIFRQYARQTNDDKRNTMDIHEFKKMVEEQMVHFREQVRDSKAMKKFYDKVDANKNGEIDFVECSAFLAEFLCFCHESLLLPEGGPHCPPHCH